MPELPVLELPDNPVWFVCDAHLGAEGAEAEARKIDALNAIAGEAIAARGCVVVVGDLFDYGFSYPSYVPPGNRDGLAWLLRLRTAGLKVVYFGGNHDCWYGDYLRRAFDVAFFADAAELRLGGIRCYAAHGDGMATNEERGYLLLKRLLRSPFSIALYRLIPPAWGTALALWCSRQSRHHGREFDPPDAEPLWRVAQQRWAEGFHAVIFGHAHVPTLRVDGGHTYLNPGDLNEHFTYGVWDGRFALREALVGAR